MSYREELAAQFVGAYDAEAFVGRAVRNARARVAGPSPRWVAVGDTFGVGSGYAHELCRRFGLNPDETVKGVPLPTGDSERG